MSACCQVSLAFWVHWVACGWWALGVAQPDPLGGNSSSGGGLGGGGGLVGGGGGEGGEGIAIGAAGVSWVYRYGLEEEHLGMRYLAAFYFAITMVAKSPWLEPSPPAEFVFASLLVLACTVRAPRLTRLSSRPQPPPPPPPPPPSVAPC